MNIVAGECTLDVILDNIESLLKETPEYNNAEASHISKKITDEFYRRLFMTPLVFHVEKGRIKESVSNGDFTNFNGYIFYIENIYELIIADNISRAEQKKIDVRWIVLESDKSIVRYRFLHILSMFDQWIQRGDRRNTVGRIDYDKLEKMVASGRRSNYLKSLFRHYRKRVYSYVLNMQTNDEKKKRKRSKRKKDK
jgi:hypothetical protein